MIESIQNCEFGFIEKVHLLAERAFEGICIEEVFFHLELDRKVAAVHALKDLLVHEVI
jgi:hypothetical protein